MSKYRIYVWPSTIEPGRMWYTLEKRGWFFWHRVKTCLSEESAREGIRRLEEAETQRRIIHV